METCYKIHDIATTQSLQLSYTYECYQVIASLRLQAASELRIDATHGTADLQVQDLRPMAGLHVSTFGSRTSLRKATKPREEALPNFASTSWKLEFTALY